MHFLNEWALGIVIASITSVIILILAPQGALFKQVRTAVSLFIMIAILYPFFISENIDTELSDFEFDKNTYSQLDSENIIVSELKKELKNRIVSTLLAENIEVEKIEIDISINEENEMSVNRIKIEVDEQYDEAMIKDLLYERSGLHVEVIK